MIDFFFHMVKRKVRERVGNRGEKRRIRERVGDRKRTVR